MASWRRAGLRVSSGPDKVHRRGHSDEVLRVFLGGVYPCGGVHGSGEIMGRGVFNNCSKSTVHFSYILSSFRRKDLVVWARTNDSGVMSRDAAANA